MSARKRIGVVGVSGYGGGEILRLCARHPAVQVVYAAGESSAGQRLGSRYPGLGGALADLTIDAFDPRNVYEKDLDLLFLSLPTGESAKAVASLPPELKVMAGGGEASLTFSPHLVPMTRGILATCYAHGKATTDQALRAAKEFYAEAAFVRVTDAPPHSKWAQGTNLAFVSYAADPEADTVI